MKKLSISLISLCILLSSCASPSVPKMDLNEADLTEEVIETPVSINEEEILEVVTPNEEQETIDIPIEESPVYTPETITISFAGDFILGSFLGQGGITFHDYFDENGYTWPLEGVKDVFLNDDITFVNLECALTDQVQTAEKEFAIKGKPEYAECLDYGGIDVVTIANNHIYDCAREVGIRDTVENLDKYDIGVCGEGYEYYTTVKGANFCFLGYRTFLVNDALKNQVASDIEYAREIGTDIVIVEFHGGTEKEYYSDPDQEEINRFAIDSGADIVLSSHPHVIQGFETYNGKVIAHGLGNFVFGTNGHPKDRDTYIFQQEFIFNAEDKTVSYGESTIIPCSVSSDPTRNNYQPMIYEKDSEDYNRVLSRLKEYSSPYNYSLPILDLGGY